MPVQDLTRTQTSRLLYYGQAGVGKRENIRLIHQFVPPESRLAVAAEDPERQIAFKLQQGDQEPRQVLVQAVDVGRERYHAAGMVQRLPFDAVVFVVNSGASHLDESLAAFESLKTYLDSWGLDLMHIPVVLQYNRVGQVDTLPVDQLESMLNPWGLLSFPAHTARGEGVRETLKAALGLAINHQRELAQQMPHRPLPGADLGLGAPQTQARSAPAAAPRAAPSASPPVTPATAPGTPAATPGTQAATPGTPAAPLPPSGPTASGGLEVEIGPPLPGSEMEAATRRRTDQILNDLNPPLVVPVKIPRHLLAGRTEPLRIMLEVEFVD